MTILSKKGNGLRDCRPLEDRIIVEPIQRKTITKSGIIIAEEWQRRATQGRVVKVGEGRVFPKTGIRIPCECKEGDIVLFSRYAGQEIKITDEEGDRAYMILKESTDIFLILPEENNEIDTDDNIFSERRGD